MCIFALPSCPVLYNLEWVPSNATEGQTDKGSDSTAWAHHKLDLFLLYRVWDYSAHNVQAWKAYGVQATLAPLGYRASLTNTAIPPLTEPEKDIDVLFFGAYTATRAYLLPAGHCRGVARGGRYAYIGMGWNEAVAQTQSSAAGLYLQVHCRAAEVLSFSFCGITAYE